MSRIAYLGSAVPLDKERQMLAYRGIGDVELCEVDADDDGQPLPGQLDQADALVIEWGKADERTFASAPRLRCVAVMRAGRGWVDDEAATRHGCWVAGVPGFFTYDVALHTLGFVIDLYKQITWFDRQVRDGSWDDMGGYDAPRPLGQVAGLVGYDGVAQALAPLLHAIGMQIVTWVPRGTASVPVDAGVRQLGSLEELLCTSDVVSLHCPLTSSTRDLICEQTLALMKPTAFLVNTARGGCIDEADLARALERGTIRAAALDVKQDETNAKGPLVGLDNCIVTPHCAYRSSDSYREMRTRALEDALAALDGRVPPDALNSVLVA